MSKRLDFKARLEEFVERAVTCTLGEHSESRKEGRRQPDLYSRFCLHSTQPTSNSTSKVQKFGLCPFICLK